MDTVKISAISFAHKTCKHRLTPGQEEIIDSAASSQVTIIPFAPRAAGRTVAIMCYLNWEMRHATYPMQIGVFGSNIREYERAFRPYHGSRNTEFVSDWNGTTISLNNRLSHRRGMVPLDLAVVDFNQNDDTYLRELIDHVMETRSYRGIRYHRVNPPIPRYNTLGDYNVPIKVEEYSGTRYIITTSYVDRVYDVMMRNGIPQEEISVVARLTTLPEYYNIVHDYNNYLYQASP